MSKQTADQIKADIKKLQAALEVVEAQEANKLPKASLGTWSTTNDRLFIRLSPTDVDKIRSYWAADRDILVLGKQADSVSVCTEGSLRSTYFPFHPLWEEN